MRVRLHAGLTALFCQIRIGADHAAALCEEDTDGDASGPLSLTGSVETDPGGQGRGQAVQTAASECTADV